MAGLEETDGESESVSKHLEGMQKAMKAAREEDTAEVSTEAPEPEEEDDEPEAPAPAQTRREKREGRMSARERAAAAEARAQVLQEQLEQVRRAPPTTEHQAPITGDVDNRIRATYKEIEKLETEYATGLQNKTMTPELERQLRDRVQELDIQRMELAAERRELQTAPQRRQQELTQRLARENPDVYGNPVAARWAHARAQQYMALGERDSQELHDKVMQETREQILKVRPKPDAIEKQRASGMSSARAAPAAEKKTISMPKGSAYYKMAVAAYPNLDPGAACQKWAQKVGKNLV